jgi:signal transduction histidine kinase
MDTLSQIKKIPELQEVPDAQLQWLIDKGEKKNLPTGAFLFRKGDPMDNMIILLSGHINFKIEQNGNFRLAGELEGPTITGLLPYSRAKEATGYGEAATDAWVLSLNRSHFHDMIIHHEELTTALVHTMSSRIRTQTRRNQQNDKIMALGKLSAGLAHELNNPSAAIVRSAQKLSKQLSDLPARFKSVVNTEVTEEEVDAVNKILFAKIGSGIQMLSMIQKSDREDELLDWLEDRDIEEAEELTNNFVDYGFTEDEMDEIEDVVQGEDISPVLHWMNQMLTTERLVKEIEEASNRINTLVSSVKSYTHMDQAPEKQHTNIHVGIENTLTMLNHKLKKGNIEIIKEFQEDIPPAFILVGEMNQVWTNLIDNAIDAMEESEKRRLTIRTEFHTKYLNIYIEDTGSGIPEDIQGKIFDPFFTTKPVGKGTGMGLEMVHQIITQQHRGIIEVDSKPGQTSFHICIPIAG